MGLSEVHLTIGLVAERSTVFKDQTLIKRSEDQDEYFFLSDQLTAICGQTFTSESIEVRSVFNRSLNFSIIRADKNLTLYCKFKTNKDLQLFFSQLRKTIPLEVSRYKGTNNGVKNQRLFLVLFDLRIWPALAFTDRFYLRPPRGEQ